MSKSTIINIFREVADRSLLINSFLETDHKQMKATIAEASAVKINYAFLAVDIVNVKYNGANKTSEVDVLIGKNVENDKYVLRKDILNVLDQHTDQLIYEVETIAKRIDRTLGVNIKLKQEDNGYTADNIVGYNLIFEITEKRKCETSQHFADSDSELSASFSYSISNGIVSFIDTSLGTIATAEWVYKHINATGNQKQVFTGNLTLVDADTWIELNITDAQGNKSQARLVIFKNQVKTSGTSFLTHSIKEIYKA